MSPLLDGTHLFSLRGLMVKYIAKMGVSTIIWLKSSFFQYISIYNIKINILIRHIYFIVNLTKNELVLLISLTFVFDSVDKFDLA